MIPSQSLPDALLRKPLLFFGIQHATFFAPTCEIRFQVLKIPRYGLCHYRSESYENLADRDVEDYLVRQGDYQ